MPGQGWGDPCEICPGKDEGEYSISTHTHTRDSCGTPVIMSVCCVSEGFTALCFAPGKSLDLDESAVGEYHTLNLHLHTLVTDDDG